MFAANLLYIIKFIAQVESSQWNTFLLLTIIQDSGYKYEVSKINIFDFFNVILQFFP